MGLKATWNRLRYLTAQGLPLSLREHGEVYQLFYETTEDLPNDHRAIENHADHDWWRMAAQECLSRGLIDGETADGWTSRQ